MNSRDWRAWKAMSHCKDELVTLFSSCCMWLVVMKPSFKNWVCFGVVWVAQLVEHLTPDFGSGHDPRVMGWNPTLGSTLGVEPAWESLSFCPSPIHSLSPSLPLSLSNKNKKIKSVVLIPTTVFSGPKISWYFSRTSLLLSTPSPSLPPGWRRGRKWS